MKKTAVLMTVWFCLAAQISLASSDLATLMKKHNLAKDDIHYWEVLNLKADDADLSSPAVQLAWVDSVAYRTQKHEEKIKPGPYLKHKAVNTLLEKNQKVFDNLKQLADTYEKLVVDMDDIHVKATNVYKKRIPSPRIRKTKYQILLKVREGYEKLRTQALEVYEQGVKVESVLTKLYNPIVDVYSMGILNEEMARNFADQYNWSEVTVDETGIEQALRNTEEIMKKAMEESQLVLEETMKNLKFISE